MTHPRKILLAMLGALPAFIVIWLAWYLAPRLDGSVSLPAEDVASRLAFGIHWLLLPGLTLFVGIVGAARRGFIADAMEGTRTPAHYGLEINLRYNQNTLEQVVIAAIAWLNLAIALPVDRLVLIPAAALLFVAGRLTFWIGYRLHPLARSFGMVLTVLPTLVAYGWLLERFALSGS